MLISDSLGGFDPGGLKSPGREWEYVGVGLQMQAGGEERGGGQQSRRRMEVSRSELSAGPVGS